MTHQTNFRIAVTVCAIILASIAAVRAQQPAKPADWHTFQFLVGDWVGDGGGQPGAGSGAFSFAYDLQNRIIVRKNFADYPATKDRPAFRHDDLMIVYYENDTIPRAAYFDNEGHVIHYTVATTDSSWAFTTSGDPATMNFRMTYRKLDAARVKISFEIAPPGKPFSPYIEATAHRK